MQKNEKWKTKTRLDIPIG